MPKVLVVGAGIAGVSAAYFLRKKGHDVTVIEGKSGIALGGTSTASPILPIATSSDINLHMIDQVAKVISPMKIINGTSFAGPKYSIFAFYDAYGSDFFFQMLTKNVVKTTQKRTLLSAYNHSLTLSLIRDLKLNVPINYGLVSVVSTTVMQNSLRRDLELHQRLIPGYDAHELDYADAGRLLPALQNSSFDVYSGIYEPSTAVLDPAVLTREMARVASEDGVKFQFDTEVTSLGLSAAGDRVDTVNTTAGPLSADAVVLAAGYSTYSLTDAICPAGALAPLIPVRNMTLSVRDTTPVTEDQPVPPAFPTRPLEMLPVTPSVVKDSIKYYPVADQIVAASEGASIVHRPHPAALDLREGQTLIAADPSNPRRYKVFAGHDMAAISEDTPRHQLISTLPAINAFRHVTQGALLATSALQDYHQRKRVDPTVVLARRVETVPEQMQLHTLGRDGLPLLGQAHTVKNLFFNVGHGHTPMATAVAGGMLTASAVNIANGLEDRIVSGLDPRDYAASRFEPRPYPVPWFAKQKETLTAEDARKVIDDAICKMK